MLDLREKLEEKSAEVRHLQTQCDNYRDTVDRLTQSNDEYVTKLEDLSQMQTQRDEQFNKQLLTQERLCDLYKVQSLPPRAYYNHMFHLNYGAFPPSERFMSVFYFRSQLRRLKASCHIFRVASLSFVIYLRLLCVVSHCLKLAFHIEGKV